MDGTGIQAAEDEDPDLLGTRALSGFLTLANVEMSEDVDSTVVEWGRFVEASFWEISHFL